MVKKNYKILDLELRNKIYVLVSKFAGSHLRELERRSGIPYSTLKYHLHYLVKHGMLVEINFKYFPKNVRFDDIEILGLLRQKNIRRILVYLLSYGKCGLSDLESFTKLSGSTVSWYLDGLVGQGIISRNRQGKRVIYRLVYEKDKIVKILITYQKSFLDNLVDKIIEMWEVR